MQLSFKNLTTRRLKEIDDDDKDHSLVKRIMTMCRKSKDDAIPHILKDKMPPKEVIELLSSSEEEGEEEEEVDEEEEMLINEAENIIYANDVTNIAGTSSIQSKDSSKKSVDDLCIDRFEERQPSDTQDDDSKERVRWFLKSMVEYDHPSVVIYE